MQSEEGNVPTPGLVKRKLVRKELGRPIQNLLHYRPLGSGTEIKKSWKIRGMFLGGFPAAHEFFPTVVLLQEHFPLC